MRLHPARALGLLAALAGAVALAAAFAGQYGEHLTPCALCLVARWPYRIAIICGLLAWRLPPRWARLALGAALLCFAADGAVAIVHTGVEWGWWQSPLPECRGPDLTGLSGKTLLNALPTLPITPCDQPVYLIPGLPISMVVMNLIYSLAATIFFAVKLPKAFRS